MTHKVKASEAIRKADELNNQICDLLGPVNERLTKLLGGDYPTEVFLQTDGWCILFSDEESDCHNASLSDIDIDKLLKMNKKDALKILQKNSI